MQLFDCSDIYYLFLLILNKEKDVTATEVLSDSACQFLCGVKCLSSYTSLRDIAKLLLKTK